jgi:Viral BACON domain
LGKWLGDEKKFSFQPREQVKENEPMNKIKYILTVAIIMMICLTTAALAVEKPPEAVTVTPDEEHSEVELELMAEAAYSRQVNPSITQMESAAVPGDVIYFSDFEVDNGGMTPSIDWVWDVYAWNGSTCDPYTNYPPPSAYSGSHMWGTQLNTCYQNLGNNSGFDTCSNTNPADDSILSLTVDLTGYDEAALSWWEWYDLFSPWDWAQVFANGVPVYNHCESSFMPPATWIQATADLTPYAGGPVTLEFHMMASTVVNHTGWYIDDLMVTGVLLVPDILVNPQLLEMTLPTGGTGMLPFTITNEGTADLTWALAGGAFWMSQDPTSGTVPSGDSTVVTVTFDATGLPPDVYTTTLDVESNDPDEPLVPIDVTMTVLSAPDIMVDPLSIEMTLLTGETDTSPFTITNEGTADLTWALGGGAYWMSQDPTSGTNPSGESTVVTVTFDATSLTPAVYTATLEVESNDPDEPLVPIDVIMTVLGDPDIVVEPLSLEMTLPPGYTDTLTFTISNIGITGLTWVLSDGAPWMSQDPTSGTVPVGGYTNVVITFDSTGLMPATYNASLEVISDDPDEPSIVLPVTLTVISSYSVLLPIVIK